MSDIKKRLKAAYENVEFYACNPWIDNADAFKKANQVLRVRESKIKDALADEPARPRTVKESIPKSRLAQYSNYEYCESRELCYASSASDISFYYPCICKRSAIREPWMLPETEQMFLWFSQAPDFNTQQLLQLEELEHLDEKDKTENHKLIHDFHKISPVFYEIFERAPGKPRYTSSSPVSEGELASLMESKLKIETPEELILWMKIRSAKVKNLWLDNSNAKKDNESIFRTPLGNYFVGNRADQPNFLYRNMATARTVSDYHLKNEDFRQLQILVESIKMLEDLLINWTRQMSVHRCKVCEAQEEAPKTEPEPVRRLYSDVLQGLQSDKKQPSYTSTPDASSREHLFSVPGVSLPKSTESLKNQVPPGCVSITQTSLWDASHPPLKASQQEAVKPGAQFNYIPSLHQKSETQNISFRPTNYPTNNNYLNYINSSPNIPCSQTNLANLPSHSISSPYMPNVNQSSHIHFNTNTCTNKNCINSSTYVNSHYSPNLQNTTLINTNSPYQVNQVSSVTPRNASSQLSRQTCAMNHPHSMWFLPPNKTPPGLYTTAYFAAQPCLLLPSPTTVVQSQLPPLTPTQNQRCNSVTHFMRAPILQSCHVPTSPQYPPTPTHQSFWEVQNQNIYRNASAQQASPFQQFVEDANTRPKPRFKRSNFSPHKEGDHLDSCENSYAKRSTSPDAAFLPPKPVFPKNDSSTSSLESRRINACSYCRDAMMLSAEKRRPAGVLNSQKENLSFFADSEESHIELPVTETASDVLEREAVEQYQPSEENIYGELERQAEEQYNDDDHLDNLKGHSERQPGFRGSNGP